MISICRDCPRRENCRTLCKKARGFADQDKVAQQELTIPTVKFQKDPPRPDFSLCKYCKAAAGRKRNHCGTPCPELLLAAQRGERVEPSDEWRRQNNSLWAKYPVDVETTPQEDLLLLILSCRLTRDDASELMGISRDHIRVVLASLKRKAKFHIMAGAWSWPYPDPPKKEADPPKNGPVIARNDLKDKMNGKQAKPPG